MLKIADFANHTLYFTGWDDVGDFSSLADLLPAEANQPRILGDSNLGQFSILRLYINWIH